MVENNKTGQDKLLWGVLNDRMKLAGVERSQRWLEMVRKLMKMGEKGGEMSENERKWAASRKTVGGGCEYIVGLDNCSKMKGNGLELMEKWRKWSKMVENG